jgi:hypothetical protein
MPFGIGNGDAIAYQDRYVIILGGAYAISAQDALQYPPREPGYYNNLVTVFDTVTEEYKVLPTPMPYGTGDIRLAIDGNTIFAVAGENIDPNTSNTTRWFRMGQIVVPEPGVIALATIGILQCLDYPIRRSRFAAAH